MQAFTGVGSIEGKLKSKCSSKAAFIGLIPYADFTSYGLSFPLACRRGGAWKWQAATPGLQVSRNYTKAKLLVRKAPRPNLRLSSGPSPSSVSQ